MFTRNLSKLSYHRFFNTCNAHIIFAASCIQKSCAWIGIMVNSEGIGISAGAVLDTAVSSIRTNADNLPETGKHQQNTSGSEPEPAFHFITFTRFSTARHRAMSKLFRKCFENPEHGAECNLCWWRPLYYCICGPGTSA